MHAVSCMLRALVTTLALVAGSTAAVADTPRADTTHQRDTRHAVLARGMSIGVSGRPRFIPIARTKFQANRIQLHLRHGGAFVQRVTLVYDGGRREMLRVDQPLNKDARTITLDVDQGLRGLLIDTRQPGYARGGGSRRLQNTTVDIVGVR